MTPEEIAYWDKWEQDFPDTNSKYFVAPDWIKAWAKKVVEEEFMPRLRRTLDQIEFENKFWKDFYDRTRD